MLRLCSKVVCNTRIRLSGVKTRLQGLSTTTPSLRGKFDGKTALITASTQGIGFSIAKKIALEGGRVMISSRNELNVTNAMAQLISLGIPRESVDGVACHVGDKLARANMIQKTVQCFGGIDILISNVGVNPYGGIGSILQCPESVLDKTIGINLKVPILLCQEVYPYLKQSDGANIIFVSTLAAMMGMAEIGHYAISKSGLFGLTKVLANQLGPENIRVNCIAPGIIKTKFAQVLTSAWPMPPDSNTCIKNYIPLKRLGEAEEIGDVVAFIASQEASYITGEIVCPTGGITSRL